MSVLIPFAMAVASLFTMIRGPIVFPCRLVATVTSGCNVVQYYQCDLPDGSVAVYTVHEHNC